MLNKLSLSRNKLIPLLILFISLLSLNTNAQEFAIKNIADSLLKDAHAIVRKTETKYTISSIKKAKCNISEAITILDKEGEEKFANVSIFHDKYTKITKLKIAIYNANGEVRKKIKKREIVDIGIVQNGTLYDDNKVILFNYYSNEFPYTITIDYQITLTDYLQFPLWLPQFTDGLAIENASLTIQTENGVTIRYRQENKKQIDTLYAKTFSRQISNLKAFEEKQFVPPILDRVPNVYFAPNTFSRDGYSGNMKDWKQFGNWIQSLANNRNDLTEERKLEMQELVHDTQDTLEMIKRIYQYMQQNTRYVNLVLGIGGFQPMLPSAVDQNGYGDCKALSFYTKSLLESVGIKANYTIVRAGSDAPKIWKDFPSQQFNHVILNIPLDNDTVWLECTSQNIPFGFLGDFTDNRFAISITDNGGELIKTPKYTQENNTKFTNANMQLNADGSLSGKIETMYSGLQYNNIIKFILDNEREQKKWLHNNLKLPEFELIHFSVTDSALRIPKARINLDVHIPRYASTSKSRIFIPLPVLFKNEIHLRADSMRQEDFFIRRSKTTKDSLIITIPEGYAVEYIPDNILIENEIGLYQSNIKISANQLYYTREYILKEGIYPSKNYLSIKNFFKAISEADHRKITLKRKL